MVDLSAALNIGTADSEGQAQGRVIDEGRIGGETLVDFHQQPQARRARLHIAHALVCRLYTCPVDATIQRWLRNVGQERSSFSGLHRMKTKHPMTMLVETLSEAFRRLRIVSMDGANKPAQGPTDIYATWRVRQRLQAEFRSRSAVEQLYDLEHPDFTPEQRHVLETPEVFANEGMERAAGQPPTVGPESPWTWKERGAAL